jgi:hypothetical protein
MPVPTNCIAAIAATAISAAISAYSMAVTPEASLEKFAAMQMIDVHLPPTDGRELVLTRYSEPEPELGLLLKKLKLELLAQPPPKITVAPARRPRCSPDLRGSAPANSDTKVSKSARIGEVRLRPLPCVWPIDMHLELTDEETFALLNLLTETIENNRYPLSLRIQTLRGILAKFVPIAPALPPPARPPTPEERDQSRRPGGRSRRGR